MLLFSVKVALPNLWLIFGCVSDLYQALLSQGFPMDKVTALLDFTLDDYISMSSGNINSYLRPPDQEHSQQNSN